MTRRSLFSRRRAGGGTVTQHAGGDAREGCYGNGYDANFDRRVVIILHLIVGSVDVLKVLRIR